MIQLCPIKTHKWFDCTQSHKLLHDICTTLTHLCSVNKKDEEKNSLTVDSDDPVSTEYIIMSCVLLFTLAVATDEPERSYKESMVISPIPMYTPICPLFHYQYFRIDCNGLMFNLRCTHYKYKREIKCSFYQSLIGLAIVNYPLLFTYNVVVA